MRILYVTASLPHGTDEAFLIPEINGLCRLGHEVLVVPRSPSGDLVHGAALLQVSAREGLYSWNVVRSAVAGVLLRGRRLFRAVHDVRLSRSFHIALKNLLVLPKAVWLADLATRWGADHIHCHWAGTTATMAMAASKLSGVPWSLTLHRWDIVENNLLDAKARSASLVRFISENGLRMARDLGIPDGGQLRVIHMGVELPDAKTSRPAGRIVLCPARLVAVKGHRFLLEAWKQMQNQGVDAELWLAGGGPQRRALETQAARLGIRHSVRFLGTIPHNRLLEMYETLGIAAVVVPSVDLGGGCHEGIPVALVEAMSHGIPAIATLTGGTGELIQGGTGLLVRPRDPAALASALRDVLSDPQRARRLGEFGRWRVAQAFNVRDVAAELAGAFEAAGSASRLTESASTSL